MSLKVTLSDELVRLGQEIEPFEKTGVSFSGDEVHVMRARLTLLARLARNQEQELSVHRLIETSRRINIEIEKISAGAEARLRELHDNVVWPDFTGGKKP